MLQGMIEAIVLVKKTISLKIIVEEKSMATIKVIATA